MIGTQGEYIGPKENQTNTSHCSGVKFLKTCSFPTLKRVVAAALAAANAVSKNQEK